MEKKPTSGHVIGTNAQLQALRPELVKLGFVDRAYNDIMGNDLEYCIMAIYGFHEEDVDNYPSNKAMQLLHGNNPISYIFVEHHFYTIPENEAPEVSAKKIRDAYYEVNPE